MSYCTELASVADSSPLLKSLQAETNKEKYPSSSSSIVKIRPTLVHYIVNGRVWYVIRSKAPIADATEYNNKAIGVNRKLLVAVVDGNVWIVTLSHSEPTACALIPEVRLEHSDDKGSTKMVQWFCQLPGVQSVEYIAVQMTSHILMRSLVAPSTLFVSTKKSSKSKHSRHELLELTELEGDQSTCSLLLIGQEIQHLHLLQKLFPDVANFTQVGAILQGDRDGNVRFSLIYYTETKVSTIRSGILLDLEEQVQLIVPCTISKPAANASLSAFEILLFIGTQGRVQVMHTTNGHSIEPQSLRKLELGRAIQSIVFLNELQVFVLCSKGSVFAFRWADLLQRIETSQSKDSWKTSSIRMERLPFQPGVMRIATNDHSQNLMILFASGRVMTIEKSSLYEKITHMLSLPATESYEKESSSVQKPMNEVKIRTLLQNIAHTSAESSALRSQSQKIDHQLKVLHSAFELLRRIETQGNQCISLDPEMLARQDQGFMSISCSIAFCPGGNWYQDKKESETKSVGLQPSRQKDLFSFAIPVLRDRQILFAQLSEPVEEETPTNQVAIQSAFRQDHDRFMPTGRKICREGASLSPLWSGAQWWTALADHAHKNASFATLWSKIAAPLGSRLTVSPPSRFVVTVPYFFSIEDEDDEDELGHSEKDRVEKMVAFLRQLLNVHKDQVPRLCRSCRTQHEKLWIVLRSCSGSLILLRFTPSEEHQQSVDISIQCSDLADLSAVRIRLAYLVDQVDFPSLKTLWFCVDESASVGDDQHLE
ncbi:hypothetical protein PsorP6_004343 [Peronosclerospora sorghi]|uniref:Uncharacterized protein n=1 Tax=Peronosclerospora sorghi TaxID=230839 RepID=A0ACC0VMU4_9STRA|nr:hypothetical protein PsorP6_004343 [Peronosclerospora sorghi]